MPSEAIRKLISVPKWMEIIVFILEHPDATLSSISRETGITYSHCHIIEKELLEKEWVALEKLDGRTNRLYLIADGLVIAKHLFDVKKLHQRAEVLSANKKLESNERYIDEAEEIENI